MYEEIYHKKVTGWIIKDLSYDCFGAIFLTSMDIEISDVEIYFIVTESKKS